MIPIQSQALRLSLVLSFSRRLISLGGLIRSPKGEVISEKLHNQSGILVGLFVECIQLGDCIVKGLLGNIASSVGAVENLVVKDRKVQRKTETDRVGRWKVRGGNSTGCLVGIQGAGGRRLAGIAGLEFGEVTVVVAWWKRMGRSGC